MGRVRGRGRALVFIRDDRNRLAPATRLSHPGRVGTGPGRTPGSGDALQASTRPRNGALRWKTLSGICSPKPKASRWQRCWAACATRPCWARVRGVSVGIEPTLDELLAQVEGFVAEGYGRVKLKIKPGWDIAVVRAVRASAGPTCPCKSTPTRPTPWPIRHG